VALWEYTHANNKLKLNEMAMKLRWNAKPAQRLPDMTCSITFYPDLINELASAIPSLTYLDDITHYFLVSALVSAIEGISIIIVL